MSRRGKMGYLPHAATLGLLAVALLVLTVAANGQDALIEAQLNAGEFAPAMNAARAAADPQQRDRWLGQIAEAQARAGNPEAALRAASEVSGDVARTEALSNLGSVPFGGQGGGTEADFDSLIDLITTTIAPTTWDAVGGPGSIAGFPTGVLVDAQGVLQPLMKQETSGQLAALHALSAVGSQHDSVRRSSALRKVSLSRLEKHVQLRMAAGQKPTEVMRAMAGLERIKYVFVYPETGDLVLAGPAGDWRWDAEDRIVSVDGNKPVVQLDDVVVVLRHMMSAPDARFGCKITPTQDALARTQAFLKESNKGAINASQRKTWLEQLRSTMGKQDIEVDGLDPRTRAARVMVEADYRMKLVGMGLEEGAPGVQSYLASIVVPPGQAPPPMGVLRWWFALNYEAVMADRDRRAFELRGQGVQVLSENELLTANGTRIHPGTSEELNRRFVESFTDHFEELCLKYPIYAELRNLCDLAIVGALVRSENLAEKTGWHMTLFGSPEYPVQLGVAPRQVDTVINHRVVNRIHIIAGVSGGVAIDPAPLVARNAIKTDEYGALERNRQDGVRREQSPGAWWWD